MINLINYQDKKKVEKKLMKQFCVRITKEDYKFLKKIDGTSLIRDLIQDLRLKSEEVENEND